MSRVMTAAAIATCLTIGVQAQDTKIKTKTETKIEDARKVTLTGCLHSMDGKFSLTNLAGGKDMPLPSTLMLNVAPDNPVNMQAHVGHRVEITGAMPKRRGDDIDVTTKTETKIETRGQPDAKVKSSGKAEIETDGRAFVMVTGLKHISPTCP